MVGCAPCPHLDIDQDHGALRFVALARECPQRDRIVRALCVRRLDRRLSDALLYLHAVQALVGLFFRGQVISGVGGFDLHGRHV